MTHPIDQSSFMIDYQPKIVDDYIIIFSDVKQALDLDIMNLGWHLEGNYLSFGLKSLQLRNVIELSIVLFIINNVCWRLD